ncbi:hypothetical protein [Mesorhizobium sp. M0618]|uniref:hypothetical protein n=1 Tax=unclassified Mesorhizobium TaxID=325217 RepID=UPI003334C370
MSMQAARSFANQGGERAGGIDCLFASLGLSLARVGLEAGPLSQWLFAAMRQAGLSVELLETQH